MGEVQWKRFVDEQPDPDTWVWLYDAGKTVFIDYWTNTSQVSHNSARLWTYATPPKPPEPDTPEIRLLDRMIADDEWLSREGLRVWRRKLVEEARRNG